MNYKAPNHVHFEITDKCNYYCEYCYRFDTQAIRASCDIEDEKVMSLAKRIAEEGIKRVTITGGEPLVKKNLVIELVKFFKEKNIGVSINTNLLLMDQDTIIKLAEIRANGFLVSCPTTEPETYNKITGGGDFEKFRQNLKLINLYGFKPFISMVLTKSNFTHIRKTASELKDIGISSFSATPMSLNIENPRHDLQLTLDEIQKCVLDLMWVQDDLKIKTDMLEPLPYCALPVEALTNKYSFIGRRCAAGVESVCIGNDGNIRACPHNPEVFGNLFNNSLEDVHISLAQFSNGTFLPEECKQCKVVQQCKAGCRVNCKACDGTWTGKGPWITGKLDREVLNVKNTNFNQNKNNPNCFNQNSNNLNSLNMNNSNNSNIRIVNKFNPNAEITLAENYKLHKVDKNKYLLILDDNILSINKRTYNLLIVLEELLPLKLIDLAKRLKTTIDNSNFSEDISLLYKNKVINFRY